jgi:hypothetical protein
MYYYKMVVVGYMVDGIVVDCPAVVADDKHLVVNKLKRID